jgi:hypothetical protein
MGLAFPNGVITGWINQIVAIGGVPITGIKNIKFKVSQAKGNEPGAGNQPVGRTRGKYTYDGLTMDIFLDEYKALTAASPNRDVRQISPFSLPVVYNNGQTQTILNNVEFTDTDYSSAEGEGATYVTVGFVFAGINE